MSLISQEMKQQVKSLLKQHEGLRLFPYDDTLGNLTIGYGRNLTSSGIRENEAEFMLEKDIDYFYQHLINTYSWFSQLDFVRQIVLIDMCFNLGVRGFAEFKEMIHCLEHCAHEAASIAMLDSKWAKQVPNRATVLASMMETGKLL